MEEIYERYWRALVADALRRLRDVGLAEDCAQETFLILIKKLEEGSKFESESQLSTFLYKTNANNAEHIKRLNARSIKATDTFIRGSDVKSEAYFEDYIVAKEEMEKLDLALKSIPLHHALATIYHYGYDLKYKDIARLVGNNCENARKYGTRGIKELKKEMDK